MKWLVRKMFTGMFMAVLACNVQALSNTQLAAQFTVLGEKRPTALRSMKGKPVYLKFWATWCQSCLQQMPHFQKVQKSYGDEIQVIALNVGLEDSPEDIQGIVEQFGLTMPMAIDDGGEMVQALGMRGTPYHVLLDKNLNLVHAGHNADENLDNKLKLLSSDERLPFLSAEKPDASKSEEAIRAISKGKHVLFFSAAWCDWYIKDTRPESAENCVIGQRWLSGLNERLPSDIQVQGYLSRLWTDDAALAKYLEKYKPTHKVITDDNNALFFHFQVKEMPTLILVKDGKEVSRVSNFQGENVQKILEQKILAF